MKDNQFKMAEARNLLRRRTQNTGTRIGKYACRHCLCQVVFRRRGQSRHKKWLHNEKDSIPGIHYTRTTCDTHKCSNPEPKGLLWIEMEKQQ